MNKSLFFVLCLISTVGFAQNEYKIAFPFAEEQTDILLKTIVNTKAFANRPRLVSPRTLDNKGMLVLINSGDWVSGFFPAELWYLYAHNHNEKWLSAAKQYTANIEAEQFNTVTHDLGFMVYCPVGLAYRITKDPHYKNVILNAAKSLATRFNDKTGVIKSWDNRKEWKYPVIIDNMMNLELLFEATKLSGDSLYYRIAVRHANTTLKNHFREDYSSFHVVDYDPETGLVVHRQTHQGYSDSSAWARGQGWGLYGYTMCYRETKNPTYLRQAEAIAKFIFSNPNLPADKVPYWDFNDPAIPNVPRDASAAALMASALYELSTYSVNGKQYKKTADQIIHNLSKSYQSRRGESQGFILLHSTGHKPAGTEIDVPISYADYYYLEALIRQERLALGQSVLSL